MHSLSFSRCLLSIEERSHMSSRGERHVSMCYDCYSCFTLIFFSYLLPLSNIRFRGRELSSKGRKSLEFIAYLYSLGTCPYPNRVPSTHSLHVIPILVLLWFAVLALFSRCFCVI